MDFEILTQVLREQLRHLLELIPEQKDLVIDGELTKPLDRVAGVSFLKQHGVDKIFKLDRTQKMLQGHPKRVYLVRSKMLTVKYIADQINAEATKGDKRSYVIILVPRRLELCEMILETEGVAGFVTVEEFPLDLIPLDSNFLSLEFPDFFRTFYLDEEYTWIHTVAASLVKLENFYGGIPSIYCLGKGSKMVYELMETMHGLSGNPPSEQKGQIQQLILVDRDVDLVTPLCTPMTYEALLDETFGITCSVISFGERVTGKTQEVKQLLTSKDELYKEIRDRHFSNVFSFLSSQTKELQSGYEKKNDLKTVGDMKDFVSNDLKGLKQQHKALTYHIGACEAIMKKKQREDFEEYIKTEHSILEGIETKENLQYIEECMFKQLPMFQSLKLMCLLSLTQDGLSSGTYKTLTGQFLHSYGFEHMVTLYQLKKLGLLQEQTSSATPVKPLARGIPVLAKSSQFRSLAKKLNLVPKSVDEINLRRPNDMSYVYSGAYTPMLCKLVEQILERGGLTGLDDVMRFVPGGVAQYHKLKPPAPGGKAFGKNAPVMVYFLGGCTYSEVAALRYLSLHSKRDITIATTAIVNADSFFASILS